MDLAGRVCLSLTLNWGSPDFNELSIINIIHGNWSINWYWTVFISSCSHSPPRHPPQKQICCDNTLFSKFMTTIEFDSRCTSPLMIIMLIIFAHCCRLQWPVPSPHTLVCPAQTGATSAGSQPESAAARACSVPAQPGQETQEIVSSETRPSLAPAPATCLGRPASGAARLIRPSQPSELFLAQLATGQ